MNEEDLLRQARLWGADAPEELTFGELRELLELGEERERRFLQALSLVAYRHAVLMVRLLAGERPPMVGEAFPFWSEEEMREARLVRARQIMERHAAVRRRKESGDVERDGRAEGG